MDNREKRPIFDLKKSNSFNSSITIKDPVTGRNVLDEILQDPAESYKVIYVFTNTDQYFFGEQCYYLIFYKHFHLILMVELRGNIYKSTIKGFK